MERLRIAHELHDLIIQDLLSLVYTLSDVQEDNGSLAPQIRIIQDELRAIVRTIRQICADLRPPMLEQDGLVTALHAWLSNMQQRHGLAISLQTQGIEDGNCDEIPNTIALCLFRIVQESLHNIHKHAAAQHVDICLAQTDTTFLLTVCDDGMGFSVSHMTKSNYDEQSFGLIGMQERLDLVGGMLEISSIVGQGTQISVSIPKRPQPYY
jgi:signal transduction histidine kinase